MHTQPAPDQALAEHPRDYSDPELRVYTDEEAEDILDSVVHYMPLMLPAMPSSPSTWPDDDPREGTPHGQM